MARVEVYTTSSCPYCVQAKRLLGARKIAYEEVNVEDDSELRADVMQRAGGRRTVPQIFIGGQSIGGYEELAALDAAGKLAEMVGAPD
jgi:glutaredoxin 3